MSDDTTTAVDDKGGQSGTYTPPASQADLDRIISERIARERARFADYDQLKAKADEHDKAVEAQKSEAQRAIERAEAAESRVAQFEKEQQISQWKADVAKTAGVPADALRGSSLEELEAHAETLKSLGVGDTKRAVGPYVPGEGGTPNGPVAGSKGDQFAQFLKQQ